MTTSQFKRYPKILVAINSGAQYIVSETWLVHSSNKKQAIDLTNLRNAQKYIINDSGIY